MKTARSVVVATASLLTLVLAGCSTAASSAAPAATSDTGPKITVVAAENEYADVVQQIGGDRVDVSAIMSDPNTDPHTFEASASVAKAVAGAQLIVQNGLGYDDFMTDLEKASPDANRSVIVAQDVLGLPDSTENPHLWYDPKTMPAVASSVADKLSALDPASADTFRANLATFTASLSGWTDALASFAKMTRKRPWR
nr:zinc ABC transporter substrate-binding protein [Microbacterium testaceum]